jgi:osmotically-inducible protein OsmY
MARQGALHPGWCIVCDINFSKGNPMKPLISALALSAALLGGYLPDAAITSEIETQLLEGEGIWTSDIIHVETAEGVVHLRGDAASEHNRQRAGKIAESVSGVREVYNEIRVR